MDKFDLINELLPFYQELLTQRQKEIVSLYYYEDLSLSEIAENLNISRNAVFDCLKKCEKILMEYEEKLKLKTLYNQREEYYQQIEENADNKIKELVDKLRQLED